MYLPSEISLDFIGSTNIFAVSSLELKEACYKVSKNLNQISLSKFTLDKFKHWKSTSINSCPLGCSYSFHVSNISTKFSSIDCFNALIQWAEVFFQCSKTSSQGAWFFSNQSRASLMSSCIISVRCSMYTNFIILIQW